MKMLQDDLARAALRSWPGLAAQIGEDPAAWRAHPLARRQDDRVARVLMRLERAGAAPLVLKHEARPVRPEGFAHAMDLHLAVQEGFPEGVPELLAADAATQSCVMRYVDGVPLARALEAATEQAAQAALLWRAGAWVAEFHRAGFGERRVFQPKYSTRYLATIIDEVEAGTRDVSERARFLGAARALIAGAAEFEGRETVSARTHGDLHMRNLLVGTERVWGIDFAGGNDAPVGHDIARLLVDYATLHAPHDRIGPGAALPAASLAAFFEGYDLTGADDPSVGLLLRHRVLADWWGLPAAEAQRSTAQERRFQRLMSLVSRVFPGL